MGNYYKLGLVIEFGEVFYWIVNFFFRNDIDDFGKWYIVNNVVEGNEMVFFDNWNGGV